MMLMRIQVQKREELLPVSYKRIGSTIEAIYTQRRPERERKKEGTLRQNVNSDVDRRRRERFLNTKVLRSAYNFRDILIQLCMLTEAQISIKHTYLKIIPSKIN